MTVKKKVVKKKKTPAKELSDSILELIRITSTVIPDDVQKVILKTVF